jgi:hypothetical protein
MPTTQSLGARILELLLVGPGSLLLFPLAWLLRATLGLSEAELLTGFVFFHLAHLINDPHFAVTYLLFYRDVHARSFDAAIPQAQRIRYLIAGFAVPLALLLASLFALTQRSPQTLGWMAQLMFLLVNWHYTKQGFGVLMVLSGRRGARFSEVERNVLLGHAYIAAAFAWAQPASASGLFEEKGVVYWAPGRPHLIELITGVLFALSAVALLIVLVQRVRRDRAAWLPLFAYLITVWLWTVFTALDPLVRYAIPAFHALQYGYFVWLVSRNEAHAKEGPPTFGPPVRTRLTMLLVSALALGWFLFRGAPSALDGWLVPGMHTTREDLGLTPFFAAFNIVVNIHHYFMDHVIWRREHGAMRWMFADPKGEVETAD